MLTILLTPMAASEKVLKVASGMATEPKAGATLVQSSAGATTILTALATATTLGLEVLVAPVFLALVAIEAVVAMGTLVAMGDLVTTATAATAAETRVAMVMEVTMVESVSMHVDGMVDGGSQEDTVVQYGEDNELLVEHDAYASHATSF